jgi:hypothetical protein
LPKYHGRHTRVYVDGYDISGYTNSLNVSTEADTVDVSSFSDTKKNYVVGLSDSQVEHDGFFDDTATAGGHAVLSQRLGSAVHFMASIGTYQGAFGHAGSAELQQMYSVTSGITDAVKHKSKLSNFGTQGVDQILLVNSKQQFSGTGAALDTGTASNAGGRAYMQNFGSWNAATPANASGSVRLIGGTDAAFTASGTVLLADFGAVTTTASAQGIAFSGTVPRYVKVDHYSGTPQTAVGFDRD